MFDDRGEIINMKTDKNGNPRKRKKIGEIREEGKSIFIQRRCHQWCQPNFCTFYGGTAWNCDGTRRLGIDIPHQTVWSVQGHLGPEWDEVTKGTALEYNNDNN